MLANDISLSSIGCCYKYLNTRVTCCQSQRKTMRKKEPVDVDYKKQTRSLSDALLIYGNGVTQSGQPPMQTVEKVEIYAMNLSRLRRGLPDQGIASLSASDPVQKIPCTYPSQLHRSEEYNFLYNQVT